MGEFDLIKKIKTIIKSEVIGDDTAPVKIGGKTFLFTNDILLEDQHFLDYFPIDNLGWKAVSVNVSDIVASGGKPKYVLVSLLLPKNKTHLVRAIYQSIKKACRFYHCQVIGGNITKSYRLGIDIFMIGETKKFVSRRNAKPGDDVCITGPIGDARAGLELLMMKKKLYEPFEKKLIETHLRPTVNIKLADYLSKIASSTIDVSDGLSSDVYHLANSSRVRIDINSKKIPVSKELLTFVKKYKKNLLDIVLIGGEDYQILFTGQKNKIQNYKSSFVGTVAPGRDVFLDGKKIKIKSFDHFSSS